VDSGTPSRKECDALTVGRLGQNPSKASLRKAKRTVGQAPGSKQDFSPPESQKKTPPGCKSWSFYLLAFPWRKRAQDSVTILLQLLVGRQAAL
jgi:hypothetical protein